MDPAHEFHTGPLKVPGVNPLLECGRPVLGPAKIEAEVGDGFMDLGMQSQGWRGLEGYAPELEGILGHPGVCLLLAPFCTSADPWPGCTPADCPDACWAQIGYQPAALEKFDEVQQDLHLIPDPRRMARSTNTNPIILRATAFSCSPKTVRTATGTLSLNFQTRA